MSFKLSFAWCLILAGCTGKKIEALAARDEGQSFFDEGRELYLDRLRAIKPTAGCVSRFAAVLEKNSLDVRIVFGYKDTRPSRFVGDPFERGALVAQLTRPCREPEMLACGMERDPDDADRFIKILNGGKRTLRLTVIQSAIGPDDQENRTRPQQEWQSRHANRAFMGGLQAADAVFYVGHSRDGGGPDFAPPKLTKNQHIDYLAYVNSKAGLKESLQALNKRNRQHPLVLGLLSCSSSEHFSKDLLKGFPPLVLLSSKVLVYYSDALENALFSLNALMRADCDPQLRAALYTRGSRMPGINVEGGNPVSRSK